MQQHVTILGVLFIVLGIFGVIGFLVIALSADRFGYRTHGYSAPSF